MKVFVGRRGQWVMVGEDPSRSGEGEGGVLVWHDEYLTVL